MLWQELARIALLGTDRTTFSEEVEAQLLEMGISEELSPAQQLLEAAAFQTQYRKVASPQVHTNTPLPSPSKLTKEAYISTKSREHLEVILEKKLFPLLPEFTGIMEEVNKVLPPEILPNLLDLCSTDFQLWDSIANAIGERGWWLLRQHPAWKQLAQQPYTTPVLSLQKVRASMEFIHKLKNSLNSNPLLVNQEHRKALQDAAFYSDLNKYDTLQDGWYLNYQFNHNWTQEVKQFLSILAFRKAMQEALLN